MSVAEMFSDFVSNLAIGNTETISTRYGELTSALNKLFRDTESKTANTLQVGSFGRITGINGISVLDKLYIMPKTKWADYNKAGGQLSLLHDAREAILKRYPTTKVKVDRLVVTVTYADFHVEVQPFFKQDDQSYLYPDTKNGGSWKTTKPREEMAAVADLDTKKNANLRPLCKITRAWKNKHGVGMGGLLLYTLAYNFLDSTTDFDTKSFLYCDWMSRDFFKYLSELPEQTEYAAPGSHQRVMVKKKFQEKAKKAHKLCVEAIEAENQKNVNDKWKKVYGRPFPASATVSQEAVAKSFAQSWDDTEEFIEDKFPVDIRESMQLDCEVKKNGFRESFLREMLARRISLMTKKSLRFEISDVSAAKLYDIYWKVLNRGDVARRGNCIRGQLIKDDGLMQRTETISFLGDHIVECYCVMDGVVVAKNRIFVPINGEQNNDD